MSEFLARLAARSVGQSGLAQPRLPGLFETGSGSEVAREAFEVVDDEVTAEPSSVVAAGAGPASAFASAGSTPSAPPAASPVDVPRTVVGITPPLEEAESGNLGLPVRARTARPLTTIEGEPAAARSLSQGQDPATTPPSYRPVPAVPLAVASPAAPRRAESISADPAASPEPSTVRVHIGRLEIRANLPDPAPARPRTPPREEADKGVSLADYLRGAR